MAFTDGVECPDLLELSSGDYTVIPGSVFTDTVELPDLLELDSGAYVAAGTKAFNPSVECPDLLELSSANYVADSIKAFSRGSDLFVTIRQFIPGDDSIEIIVGLYLDFDAQPRFGRAPLDVQFRNLSSSFFTKWQWDFGDQKSSIALNPSHVYKTPGSYDVSLRARLYPDWYTLKKRR